MKKELTGKRRYKVYPVRNRAGFIENDYFLILQVQEREFKPKNMGDAIQFDEHLIWRDAYIEDLTIHEAKETEELK
jgi:hypothetical protein